MAVSTALALPPVLGFWSLPPRVWNGRNQDAQAVQRENCVYVCVSSLLKNEEALWRSAFPEEMNPCCWLLAAFPEEMNP